MKILKTILIVVGVIIGLILIAALFIKKEYTVKSEMQMNKPYKEVFNYIKYLKNQNDYSKWAGMDPAMEKTFTGVDGTVGFISAWDSKQGDVGAGEQEIVAIEENKRIDFDIRFSRPFKSTAKAYMTTDSLTENTTNVTWVFEGKMVYPMNIMLTVVDFDKIIGGDLETGLNNLKNILEK